MGKTTYTVYKVSFYLLAIKKSRIGSPNRNLFSNWNITYYFDIHVCNMRKDYLVALMILVPFIGWLFNIYALFLFIPLGFLWSKSEKKS